MRGRAHGDPGNLDAAQFLVGMGPKADKMSPRPLNERARHAKRGATPGEAEGGGSRICLTCGRSMEQGEHSTRLIVPLTHLSPNVLPLVSVLSRPATRPSTASLLADRGPMSGGRQLLTARCMVRGLGQGKNEGED